MSGLLAIGRNPNPDAPAVSLAAFLTRAHARDIDCGHCAAQRLGIISAVKCFLVMLSKGILLGSDQVPGPHLGRLESHLPRDSVEYELEREANPVRATPR